jgi:WD40 repeat protein
MAPEPGAATEDLPQGQLAPGVVLGDRYHIRERLGSGGMGEVWRAYDVKLRVELALKALHTELTDNQDRLDLLRQEVRAARQVVSPNVCRVFDLIEVADREMVSMEYVDGTTLLHVLHERGPLELREAQEIAAQFLSGLEAIHAAGLVHRDIKPENIMLTRAGRVVVMDFGLTRDESERTQTIAGTPAYMSPEQAEGGLVDARADVYAAGVVLAEMVSPDGIRDLESRKSIWEGVRQEPVRIPQTPWAPVLERAVAREPDARQDSAHTLIRELEEVTLRLSGEQQVDPYPGLASFTEADAEYFFGREAETEAMWRRLEAPHLLGIIGPSGAGKSSFVRAGLIPARPDGWSIVVMTPGSSPLVQLGRALVPELAADTEAIQALIGATDENTLLSAIADWRGRHEQAMLVIDQFEELFTLCSEDTQHQFAELLGKAAVEIDLHVLLVMRDDFLFHCQAHAALRPVFSELTPLGPLAGAALRRALVRPASICGHRFEDEALIEEMLSKVEGERGSLPLLAFAANRLWQVRDREKGLLSREAYERIGGVGGALAQHAEEVLEEIGGEQVATVRELFRNLVTAQGTRAVRDRDALLSVFDEADRQAADEVLGRLVDARLLTTFEVEEADGSSRHRVEVVHESLLSAWPRLVRWRTQDADAAQLRDQLGQAARTWDEHQRSDDLLWTGTAYREFRVWHDQYPGGLTEIEEAFARAMAEFAGRRRRRRRLAVAAAFIVLLVILAVVGRSRQQAVTAARRAEASKLVTLGTSVLDSQRTSALAYALASVKWADNAEARRLAVRALWAGPPKTVVPDGHNAMGIAFSPDGRYLAAGYGHGSVHGEARLHPRDGGPSIQLRGFEGARDFLRGLEFSPDSSLLAGSIWGRSEVVRIWSTSDGTEVRVLEHPGVRWVGGFFARDGASVYTFAGRGFEKRADQPLRRGEITLRQWSVDGGSPKLIGSTAATNPPGSRPIPEQDLLLAGDGDAMLAHEIESFGREPGRVLARIDGGFDWTPLAFDPTRNAVMLSDHEGRLSLWPLAGDGSRPLLEIESGETSLGPGAFSADGTLFALAVGGAAMGLVWDLEGPVGVGPLTLTPESSWWVGELAFSPNGRWIAMAWVGDDGLVLWPVNHRYRRPLDAHDGSVMSLAFSPDSSRLYSQGGADGQVLWWDLEGGAGAEPEVLFERPNEGGWGLTSDPHGRFLICSFRYGVWQVHLDGSDPTLIEDFPFLRAQIDPKGRFIASSDFDPTATSRRVVVRDLETDERWELFEPGDGYVTDWSFDSEGRLLVVRGGVLSRWDPATESTEVLLDHGVGAARSIGDEGRLYVYFGGKFFADKGNEHHVLIDSVGGSRTELPLDSPFWFFTNLTPAFVSWNTEGTIVAIDSEKGEALVGDPAIGDFHLLLGHEGGQVAPLVSPDGRWIVTVGPEHSFLWPMPDLSRPPLHTLPLEEFIARIESFTNLRAVPDEESPTGYSIRADYAAYRGWAEVPEW